MEAAPPAHDGFVADAHGNLPATTEEEGVAVGEEEAPPVLGGRLPLTATMRNMLRMSAVWTRSTLTLPM